MSGSQNFRLRLIAILEAIIILVMSVFIIWICFLRDNNRAVPASTNVSEDPEIRSRPVIEKEETFYQLDGKKILVHDSALGETFIPVYGDVPASELDMDKLVSRNGYSFYKENNEIVSYAGIDISQHQGEIDWKKVKEAGIDFAIIRVGYRTYGGGIIEMDESCGKNIREADAAGIKVGVYFFSQAVNTEEAIEEADTVLNAIEGCNITYPVVFDWEMIADDHARTDSVSVDTLADCCVAFCERVRSAGYTPMIYQNKNTAMKKLDLPRVKDYDFWLAEYGREPSYYYDFRIWQYSSDGTIPGVSGRVDMNICFRDYGEE